MYMLDLVPDVSEELYADDSEELDATGQPAARWLLDSALREELYSMEPSDRVVRLQTEVDRWGTIDCLPEADLSADEYLRLLAFAIFFFSNVSNTDAEGQQKWRRSSATAKYAAVTRMPWLPFKTPNGSPVQRQAHRVIWILLHGHVTSELEVRHSCENRNDPLDKEYRNCCRIDHLSLGTTADNTMDRILRGRSRTGSRLTAEEIDYVLFFHFYGRTANAIADDLGRNFTTINNCLRRFGITPKRGRAPRLDAPPKHQTSAVSQDMPDIVDSNTGGAPHDMTANLPGTEPLLPPRAGCTPPLKWVGSKRWLVPLLSPCIYERLAATGGRYIEPFLGGGAIALDLGLSNMLLADNCQPLIVTYHAIRKSPSAVAWALKNLVDKGTDKESYLRVRAEESRSPVVAAARFLYLNRFGFNGLYRENSKGKFNVPHGGDRSNASVPDVEALTAVANALKGADLRLADFRDTIAVAQEGDVVYADSPYYDTYSGYTAGGFSDEDHVALSQALGAAHARGVAVIASNSDHERVRELYDWAFVTPVHERHAVGATAERRGLRPAVLIVSDDTILRGT